MSSVRLVSILIAAATLTAASALAQRVNPRPYEPSGPSGSGAGGSATAGGGAASGGSATSLPEGSLTPSITFTPAPQLVVREPVVLTAPAPASGAPPACYPKSQGDCASDAGQCLAREFIDANYDILWGTEGPYIYRTYWTGDDSEARATGCATDLHRCLQSGC